MEVSPIQQKSIWSRWHLLIWANLSWHSNLVCLTLDCNVEIASFPSSTTINKHSLEFEFWDVQRYSFLRKYFWIYFITKIYLFSLYYIQYINETWKLNEQVTLQVLPPANEMTKVIFSVVSVCPNHTGPRYWPLLYKAPAPRHVQTCSFWSLYYRYAGGRPPTGILSFYCVCLAV